jgi:hypothetical protein
MPSHQDNVGPLGDLCLLLYASSFSKVPHLRVLTRCVKVFHDHIFLFRANLAFQAALTGEERSSVPCILCRKRQKLKILALYLHASASYQQQLVKHTRQKNILQEPQKAEANKDWQGSKAPTLPQQTKSLGASRRR